MLEKLAQEMYKYYKEVKFYLTATLALFTSAFAYSHYQRLTGESDFGSLFLFLGVYGNAIFIGFSLCIFYMCILYAFHPQLNGKAAGRRLRLYAVRGSCALVAVFNGVHLYASLTGLNL